MTFQIRQYQKLLDLPYTSDLSFSKEQLEFWFTLTKRDVNSDISPTADLDLDEWYLCSQLYQTSHGHEIADAELLNEVKGYKRNDNQHPFSSEPKLLSLVEQALCRPGCECGTSTRYTPRVPAHFKKYKRLQFASQSFGSSLWRGGSDAYILCRWRTDREQGDDRQQTNMWAGCVRFFIEVEIVTSPPMLLESETKIHRFAVCDWYQSKTMSENLFDTVWTDHFLTTPEAANQAVIPIARLAVSFLKGRITTNDFKIMLKPNLLILWQPHQEYQDAPIVDETEPDESDSESDNESESERF